jgi:anthranilate/para-aminobenzoate synthase component I
VRPVIKELAGRWDVRAAARRLAGRPGLAVLASDARGALRPDDARASFVACDPVATSEALVPPSVAADAEPLSWRPGPRERGWNGAPAAPRWVGAVPYEALRGIERRAWAGIDTRPPSWVPRPLWRRYDAVLRIDHASGHAAIEADDALAALRLERALARPVAEGDSPGFELTPEGAGEPPEAHVARVREALRFIAQGDVYQVNLARRIPFAFRGQPLSLFLSLLDRAPAPFALFAELGDLAVCAASPELALEIRGDALRTAPIKGTRPRGADALEDARLARELDADPKERAELTMVVDLHRNDLGRVARVGSVRVLGEPRVSAGRTVWSRVAEIVALRAAGASDEDVVRAMLPCGSVTGAPKVRAMEIIAGLEPHRRGLYTGAFGYVARDGAVVLAMAIRTLEVWGRARAQYFAGGGIVEGSDPLREYEETRWKASQLMELGRT